MRVSWPLRPAARNEQAICTVFLTGPAELVTVEPDSDGARGYAVWLEQYQAGLPVERLAGEVLACLSWVMPLGLQASRTAASGRRTPGPPRRFR